MKTNELITKAFEYNKANFEKFVSSVVALQEQSERLSEKAIEEAQYIPEEGKKAATHWIELARQTREKLQKAIEENQERLEKMFIPS